MALTTPGSSAAAQTPKKDKSKDFTEHTCQTLQGTGDNETKSKLYSAQSQFGADIPSTPAPTPSKGDPPKKKTVDPKKVSFIPLI